MDRETGRSRGFGFVTYSSAEEASAAITALDGKVSIYQSMKLEINLFLYDSSKPFVVCLFSFCSFC